MRIDLEPDVQFCVRLRQVFFAMKTNPLHGRDKAPRHNESAEGYRIAMQGGQAMTGASGVQPNAWRRLR